MSEDLPPLSHDELMLRIARDLADSYDEELEMESRIIIRYRGLPAKDEAAEKEYRRYYFRELFRLQAELVKLQDWVVAAREKIVILFEGRDDRGRDARSRGLLRQRISLDGRALQPPRFSVAYVCRSTVIHCRTCACCIWPEDRLSGCELPSRHCCWRSRSTPSRMSPTGMTRHHLRQPIALRAATASRSTVLSTHLGTIIHRSPSSTAVPTCSRISRSGLRPA
jgi:hypothetical protein